jgi:hypothetical protein
MTPGSWHHAIRLMEGEASVGLLSLFGARYGSGRSHGVEPAPVFLTYFVRRDDARGIAGKTALIIVATTATEHKITFHQMCQTRPKARAKPIAPITGPIALFFWAIQYPRT